MIANELAMVDVGLIDPDPLNPQEQDSRTFDDLVEAMSQDGATEAITVIREGERFRLVAGEHRWRAAQAAGLGQLPAVIVPADRWTEDERRIRMVRSNVLRGRLNAAAFVKLVSELGQRYERPALQRLMGFDLKSAEYDRLVRSVADAVPAQLRKQIERSGKGSASVDDFAASVQALFARYGSTVDRHYVLFAYGGRTHLLVETSPRSLAEIEAWIESVEATGRPVDEVLAEVLARDRQSR